MQRHKALVFTGSLLALSLGFGGGHVRAATPTPSFTITATNTTMPASGNGTLPITLTSVDGYVGNVSVGCAPTNPPVGAKLPGCKFLPPVPYFVLTANATVAGSLDLVGPDETIPASLLHRTPNGGAAGLALAGALLFGLGFGFRRRSARWFALMLLAAGALAGMAGITACGGSSNALTPGTWSYTITGTGVSASGADIGPTVSTTANVTVL